MLKQAAAAAIGGALAVGSVPVVLNVMGFTGAGIAASSLAAKMMSAAAIANGGGVSAGSLVATLQSVDEPNAEEDQPRENVPQVEPPKPPLRSEDAEK